MPRLSVWDPIVSPVVALPLDADARPVGGRHVSSRDLPLPVELDVLPDGSSPRTEKPSSAAAKASARLFVM